MVPVPEKKFYEEKNCSESENETTLDLTVKKKDTNVDEDSTESVVSDPSPPVLLDGNLLEQRRRRRALIMDVPSSNAAGLVNKRQKLV